MNYKIKQQKDIVRFFIEEFGQEKGRLLYEKESQLLDSLIAHITEKTDSQRKTLIQTILPRIAVYKTLQNERLSKEDALSHMRTYMIETVAAKKHASTVKMENFPGFYTIYSKAFLKIMRTTDLQISTQEQGKDFYNITITSCLWHTACVEYECPELCRLFCDVDDVTYGGLRKIGFSRTQTLGYGGTCCDFHFFKK